MLIFVFISLCFAKNPYDSRLEQIHARSLKIKSKLERLGVKSFDEPQIYQPDDAKKTQDFFQIYSQKPKLIASSGSVIFGQVQNKLMVGGEPSPVVVRIKNDQGFFSRLKVLGFAHGGSVEERVFIEFDRFIDLQGQTRILTAQALDTEGTLGLPAISVSGKALAVAGAIGSSFISGVAAAAQTQTTNALGITQTQTTPKNMILQGLAQSASDQSKRLLTEATAEKPVLILEAGSEVAIFLKDEVRL